MEEGSTKKYLIWLFVFAAVNVLLIALLFSNFGAAFGGDSEEYMAVAKYFAGQGSLDSNESPNLMARLLKPAFPALVAVLSPIFGFRAPFIIINAVFYLLAGFVVFKIVKFLFNNDKQAFVASVFFLTAYPILEYGINYYTDVAGWFFFLTSIYLTALFLKNPSYKLVISNGVAVALGLFFKEYAAPAAIFFGLCLLFIHRDGFRQKLKYLAVYSLFILVPFIICQLWVYLRFDYSYYAWFSHNWSAASSYEREFLRIFIKSMAAVFFLGWVFVLIGLSKFKEMARENQKFILALILPSFAFLGHPAASSRLFYETGLLLSILASWGFIWLYEKAGRKRLAVSFLVLAVAGNYFWFIFDDRLRILINALLSIHY